jgi:hypothetical protein
VATTSEHDEGSLVGEIEGLIKGATLAVGAFAVIMYGVLVLAYAQFYGLFGISLDEVDRSKFNVLPEVLAGPVKAVLTANLFLITLGISLVGVLLVRLLWPRLPFRSTPRDRTVAPGRRNMVRTAALCLLLALTAGAVQIGRSETSIASRYGIQVRDTGFAVSGIYIEGGLMKTPLLEIIALPATVDWNSSDQEPAALKADPDCLMYMGQHDGIVVLYDVRSRSVLRLEASDILLVVRPDTAIENPKHQAAGWPCRSQT